MPGFRPANLIKKETPAQVFSCKSCEISKNTFFMEQLRWLLLNYFLIFFYWDRLVKGDFENKENVLLQFPISNVLCSYCYVIIPQINENDWYFNFLLHKVSEKHFNVSTVLLSSYWSTIHKLFWSPDKGDILWNFKRHWWKLHISAFVSILCNFLSFYLFYFFVFICLFDVVDR